MRERETMEKNVIVRRRSSLRRINYIGIVAKPNVTIDEQTPSSRSKKEQNVFRALCAGIYKRKREFSGGEPRNVPIYFHDSLSFVVLD